MIAEQRLNEILQIATQQEFVEVDALAAHFKVSTMTIRRDLQKLSELGLLQRRYGGAALTTNARLENDYSSKKDQNHTIKQNIARIALNQIHNNDILYLDAGTTTFELSVLLRPELNLTVITNDILIATELCNKDINTILLGGILQKATLTTLGPPVINSLNNLRATSAFIGATAVSTNFDVMSPTVEKAYIKKAAMQVAQKTYLMIDNSKFNSYALQQFANLSDFTGIITDRSFSDTEQYKLNSHFINIIDIDY